MWHFYLLRMLYICDIVTCWKYLIIPFPYTLHIERHFVWMLLLLCVYISHHVRKTWNYIRKIWNMGKKIFCTNAQSALYYSNSETWSRKLASENSCDRQLNPLWIWQEWNRVRMFNYNKQNSTNLYFNEIDFMSLICVSASGSFNVIDCVPTQFKSEHIFWQLLYLMAILT